MVAPAARDLDIRLGHRERPEAVVQQHPLRRRVVQQRRRVQAVQAEFAEADADGDGTFESHRDFVTGLNMCTSAITGRGGVKLSSLATARGDSTIMPCAASPP